MLRRRGQGHVSVIAEHKRRRKHNRARTIAVKGTVVVLLCVGLLALVLFLPQLSITTITITGTQTVSATDIEAIARSALAGRVWGVVPRAQFFLSPTKAIQESITQAFPRLEAVHVVRKFPHTLSIAIEEHDMWGVLCRAGACIYVSRDGTALDPAPVTEGVALIHVLDRRAGIVTAGSPAFETNTAQLLVALEEGVPAALGITARTFTLGGEYEKYIEATTQEGWRIIADADTDPARALENLKLIFAKEIKVRDHLEYIDLRLPSKVFYKFRD